MLKADETLDFHNKQIGKCNNSLCFLVFLSALLLIYLAIIRNIPSIADVALGLRCKYADRSCAYIMTSPLGHVYTNACPNGLHCVKLYGDTSYDDIKWDTKVDFIRASNLMPSNKHAKQLKKWLQAYFTNPLRCEDIELSFCGLEEYGEFNSKIWMTIKNTCPAGELMSYSELAQRSGYGAGASKVVGYAINKNPYMLVVGDHRVVKATGEIWCENDSQRNKLRRLLVQYEISFTDDNLEQALLKVKERNQSSKSTRQRKPKTEPKSRATIRKKTATKKSASKGRRRKRDEESDLEESEGEEEDDESFEA